MLTSKIDLMQGKIHFFRQFTYCRSNVDLKFYFKKNCSVWSPVDGGFSLILTSCFDTPSFTPMHRYMLGCLATENLQSFLIIIAPNGNTHPKEELTRNTNFVHSKNGDIKEIHWKIRPFLYTLRGFPLFGEWRNRIQINIQKEQCECHLKSITFSMAVGSIAQSFNEDDFIHTFSSELKKVYSKDQRHPDTLNLYTVIQNPQNTAHSLT